MKILCFTIFLTVASPIVWCQSAIKPEPVQCGNYLLTPDNVTDVTRLMGDYFAMNMNGKIPKVCAAGKYKLIGSNTFSENKTVYDDGVPVLIVGIGTLVSPGKMTLELNFLGESHHLVFYMLATNYKSYFILFGCKDDELTIIVETTTKSRAAYEEGLEAIKAKNLPLSLVNNLVNNC